MFEDRTQSYDAEIHEEYFIHEHHFPCYIIYSHVQTTATIFSERELKFMFAICHRPSVCLSSVVCL